MTAEPPRLEPQHSSLQPGACVGKRYEIRDRLGRGGMGEVWRAFDLRLRVDVALKATRGVGVAEVRAARAIVSPNVCRVFDLIETGEPCDLIAMEYVDGSTLRELLTERSPLGLAEAHAIAGQILAGLEAIHRAGAVHGDIKAENVIISRAGRVVILDFGLARAADDLAPAGRGTPGSMAPEQEGGGPVDARTDLWAAALLIAEMVDPRGVRDSSARAMVRNGAHCDPPELAETPFREVLRRGLSRDPALRHGEAAAFARDLEEVLLAHRGSPGRSPYPGLASFTAADAEHFFGRESEIEAVWRCLDGPPRILGIVGASGAGKTSFIQAGLLPASPPGWACVVITPGGAPCARLAEALQCDPDAIVPAAMRWRSSSGRALVVVDQFEELFTLNDASAQEAFSSLLARLVLEADVHAIAAIRDDFLLQCSRFEALAPIFSEITPLRAPIGNALRRAILEPAVHSGYRFEEGVLEEILAEVSEERGALPLAAFAMARLWEKRDRERRIFPRAAYASIGGVGGALAQHAEATLDRIGLDGIPVVREIFRNLVTVSGTRVARSRAEILSLAADRKQGETVLATLVDARLLTAYETEAAEGSRIEIIHESLLSTWPRLVRWEAQDAEGALLRDQLRQAAAAWSDRGRPDDLLWTGTVFREYAVWRERYAGRLTGLEEEFAQAMAARDRVDRTRRAAAIAAVFAALVATLVVTTGLWRRSEAARARAAFEVKSAEAARLVALGRAALGDDNTDALAFAIASLRTADTRAARQLAVEALAAGPVAIRVLPPAGAAGGFAFNPDGTLMATVGTDRRLSIWSRRGGAPRRSPPERAYPRERLDVRFASNDLIVARDVDRTATVWSASTGALLRTLRHDCGCVTARGMIYTCIADRGGFVFAREPAGREGRSEVARTARRPRLWNVDPNEQWILVADDEGVAILPLAGGRRRLLTEESARLLAISGDGSRVAAQRGVLTTIWDVTGSPAVVATLRARNEPAVLALDREGRRVASANNRGVEVWDLEAPPDAAPLKIDAVAVDLSFDPSGRWLTSMDQVGGDAALWPLDGAWPHILQTPEDPSFATFDVAFSEDSQALLTTYWLAEAVGIWPIGPGTPPGRVIRRAGWSAALDQDGTHLATAGRGGPVILRTIADGSSRQLGMLRPGEIPLPADFSADGSLLAFPTQWARGAGTVWIFDLRNDASWMLEPTDPLRAQPGLPATIMAAAFIRDGRLVACGNGAIRIWDVRRRTSRVLRRLGPGTIALMSMSDDGERMALVERQGAGPRTLFLCDIRAARCRTLPTEQLDVAAIDAAGRIVAWIGFDGIVRVLPFDGGLEHRLFAGRERSMDASLAFSPDGRWIAARRTDLHLWPVPDVRETPLQELPRDELLRVLERKTNVRIVDDQPTVLNDSVSWELPR